MAKHTPPNLALPRVSRALVRNVVLVLVTLDLVVLAALSVRVETRTVRTSSAAAAAPVTTGAVPAPAEPAPVDAGPPLGGGAAAVSGAIATAAAPTSKPRSPKPKASESPGPSEDSEPDQPAPVGSARAASCPVHVADSGTDGGLQSLIDFAPAFGPFSAEAFAAASAYQPALQLIGPVLAKYPTLASEIEPLLKPLIDTWGQFLDQGFTLLGPLYSPYRTSVLEAETNLAAALAPYSQQLASSPVGGCVIELQNALLHDASGA